MRFEMLRVQILNDLEEVRQGRVFVVRVLLQGLAQAEVGVDQGVFGHGRLLVVRIGCYFDGMFEILCSPLPFSYVRK